METGETQFAALAVGQPAEVLDVHPERVQQPGAQVLQQTLAGGALDDRGDRERAGLVVAEQGARFGVRRDPQETPHDVAGRVGGGLLDRLLAVTAGHVRDVPDEDAPRPLVGDVGVELGEVRQHGGVEVDEPLGHGEPEGRGREALGQRVEQVRAVGVERRPPALGHDVTVAQDLQAVRFDPGRALEGVDERGEAARVHPLGRRGAAREGPRGHVGGFGAHAVDSRPGPAEMRLRGPGAPAHHRRVLVPTRGAAAVLI